MPNGIPRGTLTPVMQIEAPVIRVETGVIPPIPQYAGNNEGNDRIPTTIANREPTLPPAPEPDEAELERVLGRDRWAPMWDQNRNRASRLELYRIRTAVKSWPDVASWQELRGADDKVGLNLLACAISIFAYPSMAGQLEDFKVMIGADSIVPVSVSGDGPDGIQIDYPNHRIYAIAGTSNETQVNAMKNGERDSYCLFGADGRPEVSYTGTKFNKGYAVAPYTTRRNPQYAGVYFKPFVEWARPWIELISGQIRPLAALHKKVAVIGHSIGGALCEVVGNWASTVISPYAGYLRGPVHNNGELARALSQVWHGGYTFGQPRVCTWDYPHVDYDSSLDPSYRHANTNYKSSMRDNYLTRDIRCINHPKDPVGYLPQQIVDPVASPFASLVDYAEQNFLPWFSNRDYQQNTYLEHAENQMHNLEADRGLPNLDFMDIANLRTLFFSCHLASGYYARMLRKANRCGARGSSAVFGDITAAIEAMDEVDSSLFPYGS